VINLIECFTRPNDGRLTPRHVPISSGLFLIGIRQARELCHSLFERFDHERSLARFDSSGSGIWGRRP
jgi:hypothetical protein